MLSQAFLPVNDAALHGLFDGYAEPHHSLRSPIPVLLLFRGAFHLLLSTCLLPSASSHPRHASVLRCFLSHLFTFLDADSADAIDRRTFLTAMALLLPSPSHIGVDRLAIAFRLMDRAGAGYLTPTSLFHAATLFVPTLLSLAHPLSSTPAPTSSPPVAYRPSFDLPSLAASVYEIAGKIVRESFGCGDLNVDGRLSEDEFRQLHLVRPSCLPFVNVLVDPERVPPRPRADSLSAANAAPQRFHPREDRHERSASMPPRAEYKGRGVEQEYQSFPRVQAHDAEDKSEETSETEEVKGEAPAGSDGIDEHLQRKMQELTMSLSQFNRYHTSGRTVQPRHTSPLERNGVVPAGGSVSAEPAGDVDEDAEQTEQFLTSMWMEMRRLASGSQSHGGGGGDGGRRKRWSNDAGAGQGEEEKEEEEAVVAELLAAQARAELPAHPLSATVEKPRLASLCSTSSFLSIHPHIAPFASLPLEGVLELFQLLMERNDRVRRDELPALISKLSIGQSQASHEIMHDTLLCLFTWFDVDEDDEVQSLDLVLALSAVCANDSREQLHVGAALCDVDADGRLTSEQVEHYLVDVMGAFFCLTEQWNTLVRLTKQEQEDKAARKRARALAQQQKKDEAEAKASAAAAATTATDGEASSSTSAPADSSAKDGDVAAPAISPSASDTSPRPQSPAFSLASLRGEVATLLIGAAATAASHCFAVYANGEEEPVATIDVAGLWEWMDRVRAEGGGGPTATGSYPMFEVVKALYALL